MNKIFLAAAIASVQLLAAQAASAATFIFTPSFSSPNDGDGLTFTSKFSQNGTYTFNLNPGSSHTLTDFLKISTKDTNSPSFLHTNEENDPLSVVLISRNRAMGAVPWPEPDLRLSPVAFSA